MEYILVFFVTVLLFSPMKYNFSTTRTRIINFFFFIIPCYLILVLFIGLRKDVGKDYFIYYNIFYNNWGENKEIGYKWINNFFSNLNFSLSSVLIFMAATTLYFVFSLILKQSNNKVFSFVLFWLDGGILYLFNVVRQGLTNFIFLNIIGKIKKRKKLITILLIVLGGLFHYSIFFALLFIPLLFKVYSKWKLLVFYLLSIVLMKTVDIQLLFVNILKYIPFFGETYIQKNLLENNVLRIDFGFGYLFNFILVFFTIIFYDKILEQDSKVIPYLNAFVFWGIFKILTLEVWVFERVLDYVRYSSIIVVPYLISIIKNKYLKFLFGSLIIICYFILYLFSTIYSSTSDNLIPYETIFSK